MTSIDTNVSNYTLAELMAIVGLNDLDPSEITKKTDKQITRFKSKNPELSVFFQAIQSELLQYADGLKDADTREDDEYDTSKKIVVEGFGNMSNEAVYPSGEKQISNWYQNQNLEQSDTNQTNKITDRKR